MISERIISDVGAAPGEFVTPPGYAHLSLTLVDAVYSIRSRYPAVERVVAAYCAASGTACQPLAAHSEPGFREHVLDCLLDRAETQHGELLADRLFGGSRSRTAGRLKADVCVEAARRLQAVPVSRIPDLRRRADDAEVPMPWT
jgi:dienelactone hydrolase